MRQELFCQHGCARSASEWLRRSSLSLLLAVVALVAVPGCPSFKVYKDTYTIDKCGKEKRTSHERGIIYYPPKPYLLVTRNVAMAGTPAPEKKPSAENPSGTPAPKSTIEAILDKVPDAKFAMQVIYLPNFDEPRRIELDPGWGSVDASLTLANGWQLTSANIKLNSKVSETITALGSAAGAAAPLLATAGGTTAGSNTLLEMLKLLPGSPLAATDSDGKAMFMPDSLQADVGPGVWLVDLETYKVKRIYP